MISILITVIIQILLNLFFAYVISINYVRTYKICSYTFFIGIPIILPIIGILRTLMALSMSGAPDSVSLALNLSGVLPWGFTILIMTGIQIVFNTYILKQIVTRKSNKAAHISND